MDSCKSFKWPFQSIVLDRCPIKHRLCSHLSKAAQFKQRPTDGSRAQSVKPPDPLPNTFPMSTHNTWKCNQADCLKRPLKWILNMLVYISQVCFRAPQQVPPRSIQSPLTLEGKYGIKEWFKGTAHGKTKMWFCFLLFAKFCLLSQASIMLFLILVVILSFRSTANASTMFFGH